jgi:thiol-disulfide isomerase/thioredoxin
MKSLDKREKILAGSTAILLALVIFGATQNPGQAPSTNTKGDWQEVELKDVNSGENFTVASLEKPVLVESFAVWCPLCTQQQRILKEFHKEADVTSVSLNVDPEEDKQKILSHTEEHDFDWRYAISPPILTRKLINRYGPSIASPSSTPMILVCENGTRKLPNGRKPVSKLQEEVEKGC